MIAIQRLGELAAQAYIDGGEQVLCEGNISATITRESGAFVVACRGTVIADLANVTRDLRAWPRPRWNVGLVHPGFYDGSGEIYDQIETEVLGLCTPISKAKPHGLPPLDLCICGHSMGAAFALSLAARFRAKGIASTVLCLAPPRVGGAHFRYALWGCDLHLFRRANDVVPGVPFLPPIYLHPAPLTHLAPHEMDELVSAHSVAKYVADLNAYLEKDPSK